MTRTILQSFNQKNQSLYNHNCIKNLFTLSLSKPKISSMKKVALTIIIATAVITGAWSQVNFGIKAGLNIANQVYTGGGFTSSPGSLLGFHGGVYLHAKMGKFGI